MTFLAKAPLLVAVLLLASCHSVLAEEWEWYETPLQLSNGTAGYVNYTAQCNLCPTNFACIGGNSNSCCGGYIGNVTSGDLSYMCASNCMASNRQCCGCNNPLPGQTADPNLLCVSCLTTEKCYYKPSNYTNIHYYCVNAASTLSFNALLLAFLLMLAIFGQNFS